MQELPSCGDAQNLQGGVLAYIGVLYMRSTIKKMLILAKNLQPTIVWFSAVLVSFIIALAIVMSTHDQIVLDFDDYTHGIKVHLVIDKHSELK